MSRLSPAALAAHRLLAEQLRELTADGVRVPCHGSTLPISEDPDDRATAAAWCPPCPVLDACRAAGAHERHGIWGSVDRTPLLKITTTTKETTR